jgi:hypothetical protein
MEETGYDEVWWLVKGDGNNKRLLHEIRQD